ncbi:hypothetical protein [Flavobacterium soli]|uniref:hypothetical protein n=1 Tax=Flavobacterium soli TaxID=344881 RepID=UPI0004078678|nr:hypothetical protein [Flavobacterium soli]
MLESKSANGLDDLLSKGNSEKEVDDKIKSEVLKEIQDFTSWLNLEKYCTETFQVSNIKIEPFSKDDWIMRVDQIEDRKEVFFNPNLLKNSSKEFFKVVVLHEYFHLLVQKVPNKEDATKIKDNFGNDFMSLIDIEADFYVALYLKSEKGYSKQKYWETYFEGVRVFKDDWIRNKKFERFLGSILTINRLFANDGVFDLILPSITPLFTEDHIKVLVLKKEHIYFDTLPLSLEELKEMRGIYLNPTDYDFEDYYKKIEDFTKQSKVEVLTKMTNLN